MANTKNCPYCEGEISASARKCRHCGEWTKATATATPSEKNVMRSDRRATGAAWGIAFIGMIFGTLSCASGAFGLGYGLVLVSLVVACAVYYL